MTDERPAAANVAPSLEEGACPCGRPDCKLLATIAALRAELRHYQALADTDALTGLHNFRYFMHSLEQELERARRSRQPVALLGIDLDHFKRVNDEYGHATGNAALVHIAGLLRETLRRLDIICRYGGEEFVVIMPATALHTAWLVAERLRRAIADTPLPSAAGAVPLTASIGVDVHDGSPCEGAEAFMARVDALLYAAKDGGRNRVVRGGADLAPGGLNVAERDTLDQLFDAQGDEQSGPPEP